MNETLYTKFLSHFQHGVMKASRYEVIFRLPAGIGNTHGVAVDQRALAGYVSGYEQGLNAQQGVNIKCHTMTFPQRSLATYEHRQNSAPFAVPFSATYDPVTFSFYADGRLDTRRYFDIWHATVVNTKTNTLNFYNEFTSDVEMWALTDADKRAYGVKLYKAYPLSVGAVDMSYSNLNNFVNVISTLTYKYWEPIR